MPDVRRIRSQERDAALDLIVAAFSADPQVRWWFSRDDRYPGLARRFFGVLLDTRIEGGEVWVAQDVAAVSMWIPPGGNLIGPDLAASRYGDVLAGLPPDVRRRVMLTDELVDGVLPREPHWYLGVLASRPDRRGEGLGWAVAAPVLAAADRTHLPVVLETSSARNVAYYTRRGFVVVAEFPLVDSAASRACGPAVRVMQRDPVRPRA